jgi:hypothetical protein
MLEQLEREDTVERRVREWQSFVDVRLHEVEARGARELDVRRAQVGPRVRELEALLARDGREPGSFRADVEDALAGTKLGGSDRLAKAEQRLGIALRLLRGALVVELLEAGGGVRAAMLAA